MRHGDEIIIPDYAGHGIANLMASVCRALGGMDTGYPLLDGVAHEEWFRARNLVLLVIDGLGYRYLRSFGQGSLLETHCRKRLTSVCPSTTASAVPTFMTGLPPQQHGFTGWFTYFSELGSVLAVLPFQSRLGREPIDEHLLTPADLCGVGSFPQRLPVSAHALMPDWIADSVFNRAFSEGTSVQPFSSLDDLESRLLRLLVRGGGRKYISAYWPDLDSLAHEHGVASPQVRDHFERLDQLFGSLIEGMRGSDTLLLVTADHGLIDTSPESGIRLSEHPGLAETLMVPLCGEPRFAFCYLHPGREAQFRSYVEECFGAEILLLPSAQLLDEGWFGRGLPHPRLRDRIGQFALIMRKEYIIQGAIPGERIRSHVGVHGGVSPDEMYVPLICAAG